MMSANEQFDSVWNSITDTPEHAANRRARAVLRRQIAAIIEPNGWKQIEAADRAGVTQPRVNDLLCGRVSPFSLDALVNIVTAHARRVHVDVDAA
jgi:predicted XRE-type DNA-binding protein